MSIGKTIIYIAFLSTINFHNALATRPFIETHEVIAKEGDVFDGVAYPPGTRVSIEAKTNKVGYVFLSQDFEMNGHVIMKGTQLYVPDGKLSCYWSKDGQKVGRTVLHKDAQVCFRRDGSLEMIHLKRAARIQRRIYSEHSWVQFHPSGMVAKGILGRSVEISGIKCSSGDVSFDESGQLESCNSADIPK